MKKNLMLFLLLIMSFSTAIAQDNLRYINVFPESTKLNALDILDDFVITVGDFGIIKYSSDYGETWFTVQTPTRKILNDITIVDSERAIAVGEDGCVIYTENSGVSWKILDINSNADLMDVKYEDSGYGLIVGKNGFLAESKGNLLNWKIVDTQVLEDLNVSCIFNSESALVCGNSGKILSKKGDDWSVSGISEKDDIVKIEKKDENRAFLVTANLNGYITTDRGKSWEKVYIDAMESHEISKIVDLVIGEYVSVIVIRANGLNNPALEYVSSNLYTWNKAYKSIMNNGYGNNDICFADGAERGIAVDNYGEISLVDPGIYYGFIYSKILHTDLRYITDFEIYNQDIWAVLGRSYYKFHLSLDGGNKWENIDLDIADTVENINFTSMLMPEYNSIYIGLDKIRIKEEGNTTTFSYDAVFIKTDYDGNVLKYHEFPENYSGEGMDFIDENIGIYYSSNGCWLTTDAGDSWETIDRNKNRYMRGMKLIEPNVIMSLEKKYYVDTTYLCKSEDFGKTWTEYEIPYNLNDYYCKGKDTILADYSEFVTENTYSPHLLLSVDGGQTWKDLDINIGDLANRYTFSYALYDDSKIIAVCGVGLQVLCTSYDMGANWYKDAFFITEELNGNNVIDLEFLEGEPILVCSEQFLLAPEDESGIEEVFTSSVNTDISIYPNPADKILNIDSKEFNIANVKIFSSDLRLVKEHIVEMSNQKVEINLEDLNSGSYTILITDHEDKLISRSIKVVR